jgi:hypothetical protein
VIVSGVSSRIRRSLSYRLLFDLPAVVAASLTACWGLIQALESDADTPLYKMIRTDRRAIAAKRCVAKASPRPCPRILQSYGWTNAVGSPIPGSGSPISGSELPVLDRRRSLLRWRWRQCGLGARLLRLWLGTSWLGRNGRWSCACRRRIGRGGWFGFRVRVRLQGWGSLRHLPGIAGHELGQRKRRNNEAEHDQRGRTDHNVSVVALAVIERHIV